MHRCEIEIRSEDNGAVGLTVFYAACDPGADGQDWAGRLAEDSFRG